MVGSFIPAPLRRRPNADVPVWEGVYERFSEVPVRGQGFDSGEWVQAAEAFTQSHVAVPGMTSRPALAAAVRECSARRDVVRVLDFGGGAGAAYVELRRLAGDACLEHVVVERTRLAARGRSLFAGDPAIRFVDSLPATDAQFDLIYLGSVLQYIEDHAALFQVLAGYGAEWLVLDDVPAGDIPDYVTGQYNVQGSVIPYRFFNLPQLILLIGAHGYALHTRHESTRAYHQDNFPPGYRLRHGCSLLFEHREPRGKTR